MTDADKPEFVAVLTELALLKPGAKLTTEAHRAWWNALRGKWTLEEFRRAAVHLRDTMEFMPNPFHFEQLRKAADVTAGEAWNLAVRSCGSAIQLGYVTHNGTSGDERVDRAVRALGGYGVIAMCDTDKLHFLERRFTEHYDRFAEADEAREAVPAIAREVRAALSGPAPQPRIEPREVTPVSAAPARPGPVRANHLRKAAHAPADLENFARRMANTGADCEAITKMLAQHGVTGQQVRQWLGNGPSASEDAA